MLIFVLLIVFYEMQVIIIPQKMCAKKEFVLYCKEDYDIDNFDLKYFFDLFYIEFYKMDI